MSEVYTEFTNRETAERHLNEKIVAKVKRVEWDCGELTVEQKDLVKLMIEDLYASEDNIKKYRKNLSHARKDMIELRLLLASFGGSRLKKYIQDI